MRVLLQRVTRAEVRIQGASAGRIGTGLLALVGFTHDDGPEQLAWMADKVVSLRIFPDAAGKMNLAVTDIPDAALLVVSQFTLYGDAVKGRRPGFVDAARPEHAIPLYEEFIRLLRARGIPTQTGEFGAEMQVELVNDGPATFWIER